MLHLTAQHRMEVFGMKTFNHLKQLYKNMPREFIIHFSSRIDKKKLYIALLMQLIAKNKPSQTVCMLGVKAYISF